jgi:tetratricopeptide (TPR) repeat protein
MSDGCSWKLTALLLIPILLGGCVKMALRSSSTLIPDLAKAFFEECDPLLAEKAIPGNLKLMEGLLKTDPKNRQILISLAMGFCGYSFLFVEPDDPRRASALYLRARDFGVQALGAKGIALMDSATTERFGAVLRDIHAKDLEPLFWVAMSWNAWIGLNLHKPAALAQLNRAQACLKQTLEIDDKYLHGIPNILMGVSLASQPSFAGGDTERAKAYFERSLRLSNRGFLMAQYAFARYYTVRVQDKALFLELTEEILAADPRALGSVCLINSVLQERARRLRAEVDDLFI